MPESLRPPARGSEAAWPATQVPAEHTIARGIFFLVTLLLPWLFLWNGLRVEWSVNEQYGYGWFVPPFAMLLFFLRGPDAPACHPPANGPWLLAGSAAALLVLIPLRLIQIPNPDWRSAFWLQALLCAGLSVALLWAWGGKKWARHFLFPILFLLVAVPWPSEIEEPLVQGLMREIAGLVAETMNLLGIPARQVGNLIQLRGQTVGVNEACSGIRSLQTTLMAGLLLGELRRLSAARRTALLGGGLALALLANYLRSGILVWIAGQQGVAALERWHDTAGLLVLVVVICGLYLFSSWLHQPAGGVPLPQPNKLAWSESAKSSSLAFSLSGLIFCGTLLSESFAHSWYASSPSNGLAPWSIREPAEAPAYRPTPIDNRTRSYLRYDRAIAGSWKSADRPTSSCTMFFLRWEAGRTSALRATMHQPHVCLTAIGLKQQADYGVQIWNFPKDLQLPVREYIFQQGGRDVNVFYIVWREGLSGPLPDVGNRWSRLDGVREHRLNPASQTLELVVAGAPDRSRAQAIFRQEMNRLLLSTAQG